MASAVLANQNDAMGKISSYSNHLNPNPNPKKKQKQFHGAAANGVFRRYPNNNRINVDPPAVTQTASIDDAYSYNQTSTSRDAFNYGGYTTFNFSSYTRSELRELRLRLTAELEQVRELRDRIDILNPKSQPKMKKLPPGGNKRHAFGSGPRRNDEMGNGNSNLSLSPAIVEVLLKDCKQILVKLMKHKFAYLFKQPVDAVAFGLHDYHQIVKRPMDLGTVKTNLSKNLYPTPVEFAADVRLTFNNALLYNPKADPVHEMAEKMLARFEELFRPVQEKIDSTVGSQRREVEFNESRVSNEETMQFRGNEELHGSSWTNYNHINSNPVFPSLLRGKKSKPKMSPAPVPQVPWKSERVQMPMQVHSSPATPSHPPPMQEQVMPSPVRAPVKENKVGRVGTMKLPKPRAKDPNKREMNMEEKHKLGLELQSLPQEKMQQLLQIVRKRNGHLVQDGDEIEMDMEVLDTETLWELDRFVMNWKKMVSKTKRQALMMGGELGGGNTASSLPVAEADSGGMSDKNDDSVKKLKENDDEDVDIDDDMPATSFPPVEIEKDKGAGVGIGGGGHDHNHDQNNQDEHANVSSSSSSSGSSTSDSSSSSDSDSGSSSGSDSDADDAQS